ncbi:MAG TPA: sulfite exporter TauE/SafE family protein [Chloroflexota bacterium]|nr:sulfite exporter TauE/SafE family protein [Chloroflexota bacterium]
MIESGVRPSRPGVAFLFAVPIGVLGGLIGLGGAEFRLPVLAGVLGYAARQAVSLNLAVSMVTLAASLAIRGTTLSLAPLAPLAPVLPALIAGAMVTAFIGPALAGRLSNEQLERVILVLLVGIGLALIVEGLVAKESGGLIPLVLAGQVLAGVGFGLAIGLVSSLLGVAGGELIIPTLVFAFGADIKTAGTGSLLVSLPTVFVGLVRYARLGAFADGQPWLDTVAPMGVGSIIGALIGGAIVGVIPAGILKIGLGVILNVSALRIFHHTRSSRRA